LTIASLKVKAAIDPIIRSAPVRLSERGMACLFFDHIHKH
jgi:hypothetical protein